MSAEFFFYESMYSADSHRAKIPEILWTLSTCIVLEKPVALYSGDSHRAKIPALLMGWITTGTPLQEQKDRTTRTFTLNAETGTYNMTALHAPSHSMQKQVRTT